MSPQDSQGRGVTSAQLKTMLGDGGELALLDVREERVFGQCHLLFAVPLALSRLELRIRGLVPRLGTRIVVCDGGEEGLAARAADRLEAIGYTDVSVLPEGPEGWQAAGFELYSGMHVPSKAFGEFVEHRYDTPAIDASELNDLLSEDTDLVILDSRPMDEYHRMNIPGGVNVPGAELVYRVGQMAPKPETLVVVNCAGRTRSIIGAQSLINAGIPNKVVALRNGTMGWHLSGFGLEHGQQRRPPQISPDTVGTARERAEAVARRFGVPRVEHATLARWQAEAEVKSLYLLDVRLPEEFLTGHLPGARNAPGGQLVQATDYYVGTRNARLVLVDDTEVRALMTASWLRQMGWHDVHVLAGGFRPYGLEDGGERVEIPGVLEGGAEEISPEELELALQNNSVQVLDLATSPAYKRGHLPGAWFAIRSRLTQALAALPNKDDIVLTSEDGTVAWLAAGEALAAGAGRVRVLRGGTRAWQGAGKPLNEGEEQMACPPDDFFPKPYDNEKAVESHMREYLSWELDLVAQIEREGLADFRYFPPA